MKHPSPHAVPSGQHIALVTPRFHGLHEAIAHALRQLDQRVSVIVYDARQGITTKVVEKIRTDVPERLGRDVLPAVRSRTTNLVSQALGSLNFDVLLTIKGDVLEPQLVQDHSKRGKKTIVWVYDALINTHHTAETLSYYDLVASFSPSDVQALSMEGLNARFLPLAADELFMNAPPSAVTGPDVVFFGARYDQRESWLQHLHSSGYSVMAYGRDWSRRPRDRVRSLSWHRPSFPTASDIPREQISLVASQAQSVLNMHNRNQDGFNLRTFEVPGAGGFALIDRDDIAQFYEPGEEVLVYASLDEAEDFLSRAKKDPHWARGIREAGWRRTQAEHTFTHRVTELLGW